MWLGSLTVPTWPKMFTMDVKQQHNNLNIYLTAVFLWKTANHFCMEVFITRLWVITFHEKYRGILIWGLNRQKSSQYKYQHYHSLDLALQLYYAYSVIPLTSPQTQTYRGVSMARWFGQSVIHKGGFKSSWLCPNINVAPLHRTLHNYPPIVLM